MTLWLTCKVIFITLRALPEGDNVWTTLPGTETMQSDRHSGLMMDMQYDFYLTQSVA